MWCLYDVILNFVVGKVTNNLLLKAYSGRCLNMVFKKLDIRKKTETVQT